MQACSLLPCWFHLLVSAGTTLKSCFGWPTYYQSLSSLEIKMLMYLRLSFCLFFFSVPLVRHRSVSTLQDRFGCCAHVRGLTLGSLFSTLPAVWYSGWGRLALFSDTFRLSVSQRFPWWLPKSELKNHQAHNIDETHWWFWAKTEYHLSRWFKG